jgi:FixJ family two-component response regulator
VELALLKKMTATGQRIVIVEDDPGMSQAVERLLGAAGYGSVTFASAEALLDVAPVDNTCCYVFDIRLTGMSGLDLTEHLYDAGNAVPVILITAHDEEARQPHPALTRAAALFTKPFSGRAFVDAVRNAVATPAAERSS